MDADVLRSNGRGGGVVRCGRSKGSEDLGTEGRGRSREGEFGNKRVCGHGRRYGYGCRGERGGRGDLGRVLEEDEEDEEWASRLEPSAVRKVYTV